MMLSRAAVRRIAQAAVIAEVRRLREHDGVNDGDIWPDSLSIGDGGLGLDSLERLGALAALAELFGLDDASLGGPPPATVGAWLDWIMAGQASTAARLTVRTSGSTGSPVACHHRVADLMEEADYFGGRFDDRRRVVTLVPGHHLYGLIWTVLLPDRSGLPVVSRTLGTTLGLTPGDLVVAVPDQWRAMLRMVRQFPTDVVGVSSAGPLENGLAADLLTAGLDRLVDVYGSSETGGVAFRDAPGAAHRLLPRWRLTGRPDGDWGVQDVDGNDHPLPDHVEPVGPDEFRLLGRRDGAVQVGGHNVWPARIGSLLRTVDGVAEAAVRLGSDGRLKAFIVPCAGAEPAVLAPRIAKLATDRLSAPEWLQQIRYGAVLPRNDMGKEADWG